MEPLATALRASREDPAAFEQVFTDQFDRLPNRTVKQVFDSEIAVDITAETPAEAEGNAVVASLVPAVLGNSLSRNPAKCDLHG